MTNLRWWEDPEQVNRLTKRYEVVNVDRRQVMKLVGAAAGVSSMAAFLAACGGDDDDDDSSGDDDASGDATEPADTGGDATEPADTGGEATEPADSGGEATEPAEMTDDATEPAADSGAAEGDLAEEQVFRTPDSEDPAHFDFNRDLYAGGAAMIFAQLGKFDVDYTAVPDIAESWEPNEDASVWTFNIRQDTKWSNGDPVTAHDYVFSFKRQLDPATEASYAGFLYDIKNAESFNTGQGATIDDVGVRAIDDYTLETTMEQPTAYWPDVFSYVAAAPAHQPSVEQYGDVWTDPNEVEEVVSNGPFKLIEWNHNVQYVIVKNDQYYDAPNITLDRVEYPVIPAEGWMLAYENDEIDQILRGELGQLDRIDGDEQLSAEKFIFNTYGTWYLVPDPNFEPFDVPEVRLAMAKAIDREVISNQVLRGLGKPAYTFQPPGTPSFIEETWPDLTAYDPEAAMSLLDGTPYEGGQNWPKITMTHREEGDGPKIAADAMINMLKENLGMEIEHEIGEPRTTYQRMYNHEIQLMWVRWYIDYPDPNNMAFTVWYSQFPSGSRHSWSNPEYDQLVSDARSVGDFEERLEMYKQAQQIQLQDGAAIYVYYVYAYGLNKPWLSGMPVNTAGEPTPGWNVFIRDLDYYKMLTR